MERKRLTRQERRLMTHAMLVDAAEEVFLREGFEHASVEQIREATGRLIWTSSAMRMPRLSSTTF